MITKDTQFVFVDEFTEPNLNAHDAKSVLQGGFTVTATKHKTGVHFENTANFYITAQHEPNWGDVENTNVYERLEPFHMKPLEKRNLLVNEWLKRNAMHCVVWAGLEIRRHWDHVPEEDRFFTIPSSPTPTMKFMESLNKRIRYGSLYSPLEVEQVS